MNTNKNGHIFLDIYGNPVRQNSPCLSTGYGYRAYVSSEDTFINQLFREICMWGGATDTYETREGQYYNQYELDCRDKAFFKSDSFKKICQKHDIELEIYEEGSDTKIIRDFWDQMKHR